jgi:hypothetical protein
VTVHDERYEQINVAITMLFMVLSNIEILVELFTQPEARVAQVCV